MAPAAPSEADGLLRNRRLLGVLISVGLVLLVVGSVIGFSGAYFSSTSRSPGNEFAAAGMALKLTNPDQIVAAGGMLPGDTRSGDQTVTNNGHSGLLRLAILNLKSTKLSRVLDLRVRETGADPPVELYDGPLVDMLPLELGTIEQDEARVFTFTLSWPSTRTTRTCPRTRSTSTSTGS